MEEEAKKEEQEDEYELEEHNKEGEQQQQQQPGDDKANKIVNEERTKQNKITSNSGSQTARQESGKTKMTSGKQQDQPKQAEQLKQLAASLRSAANEGKVELVRLLLRCGADVNAQDEEFGNTALHQAAWNGYSETIQVLCRHRASTSIKNKYGDTALHTAARYGHAGVARILLSAKCNPNQVNKQNETAMDIALRKDLIDIQELIANPPAPPSKRAAQLKLDQLRQHKSMSQLNTANWTTNAPNNKCDDGSHQANKLGHPQHQNAADALGPAPADDMRHHQLLCSQLYSSSRLQAEFLQPDEASSSQQLQLNSRHKHHAHGHHHSHHHHHHHGHRKRHSRRHTRRSHDFQHRLPLTGAGGGLDLNDLEAGDRRRRGRSSVELGLGVRESTPVDAGPTDAALLGAHRLRATSAACFTTTSENSLNLGKIIPRGEEMGVDIGPGSSSGQQPSTAPRKLTSLQQQQQDRRSRAQTLVAGLDKLELLHDSHQDRGATFVIRPAANGDGASAGQGNRKQQQQGRASRSSPTSSVRLSRGRLLVRPRRLTVAGQHQSQTLASAAAALPASLMSLKLNKRSTNLGTCMGKLSLLQLRNMVSRREAQKVEATTKTTALMAAEREQEQDKSSQNEWQREPEEEEERQAAVSQRVPVGGRRQQRLEREQQLSRKQEDEQADGQATRTDAGATQQLTGANDTVRCLMRAPNGTKLLTTKPLAPLDDDTQLYAIPRKSSAKLKANALKDKRQQQVASEPALEKRILQIHAKDMKPNDAANDATAQRDANNDNDTDKRFGERDFSQLRQQQQRENKSTTTTTIKTTTTAAKDLVGEGDDVSNSAKQQQYQHLQAAKRTDSLPPLTSGGDGANGNEPALTGSDSGHSVASHSCSTTPPAVDAGAIQQQRRQQHFHAHLQTSKVHHRQQQNHHHRLQITTGARGGCGDGDDAASNGSLSAPPSELSISSESGQMVLSSSSPSSLVDNDNDDRQARAAATVCQRQQRHSSASLAASKLNNDDIIARKLSTALPPVQKHNNNTEPMGACNGTNTLAGLVSLAVAAEDYDDRDFCAPGYSVVRRVGERAKSDSGKKEELIDDHDTCLCPLGRSGGSDDNIREQEQQQQRDEVGAMNKTTLTNGNTDEASGKRRKSANYKLRQLLHLEPKKSNKAVTKLANNGGSNRPHSIGATSCLRSGDCDDVTTTAGLLSKVGESDQKQMSAGKGAPLQRDRCTSIVDIKAAAASLSRASNNHEDCKGRDSDDGDNDNDYLAADDSDKLISPKSGLSGAHAELIATQKSLAAAAAAKVRRDRLAKLVRSKQETSSLLDDHNNEQQSDQLSSNCRLLTVKTGDAAPYSWLDQHRHRLHHHECDNNNIIGAELTAARAQTGQQQQQPTTKLAAGALSVTGAKTNGILAATDHHHRSGTNSVGMSDSSPSNNGASESDNSLVGGHLVQKQSQQQQQQQQDCEPAPLNGKLLVVKSKAQQSGTTASATGSSGPFGILSRILLNNTSKSRRSVVSVSNKAMANGKSNASGNGTQTGQLLENGGGGKRNSSTSPPNFGGSISSCSTMSSPSMSNSNTNNTPSQSSPLHLDDCSSTNTAATTATATSTANVSPTTGASESASEAAANCQGNKIATNPIDHLSSGSRRPIVLSQSNELCLSNGNIETAESGHKQDQQVLNKQHESRLPPKGVLKNGFSRLHAATNRQQQMSTSEQSDKFASILVDSDQPNALINGLPRVASYTHLSTLTAKQQQEHQQHVNLCNYHALNRSHMIQAKYSPYLPYALGRYSIHETCDPSAPSSNLIMQESHCNPDDDLNHYHHYGRQQLQLQHHQQHHHHRSTSNISQLGHYYPASLDAIQVRDHYDNGSPLAAGYNGRRGAAAHQQANSTIDSDTSMVCNYSHDDSAIYIPPYLSSASGPDTKQLHHLSHNHQSHGLMVPVSLASSPGGTHMLAACHRTGSQEHGRITSQNYYNRFEYDQQPRPKSSLDTMISMSSYPLQQGSPSTGGAPKTIGSDTHGQRLAGATATTTTLTEKCNHANRRTIISGNDHSIDHEDTHILDQQQQRERGLINGRLFQRHNTNHETSQHFNVTQNAIYASNHLHQHLNSELTVLPTTATSHSSSTSTSSGTLVGDECRQLKQAQSEPKHQQAEGSNGGVTSQRHRAGHKSLVHVNQQPAPKTSHDNSEQSHKRQLNGSPPELPPKIAANGKMTSRVSIGNGLYRGFNEGKLDKSSDRYQQQVEDYDDYAGATVL